MQTTKYKNKVAVVATLSHLADGKSRIRYISLCRYFLYQTVSNNQAWFTDRLEPGNHTHICQSTGAVHHSSPTQIHRLRCCRRIRGGICWVSVLVTNLRWTCQCAILASLQMFIYTKPHSKITRGCLINLSILRFYWWMDMSPRGHGICTCYVAKYLAQWHADGNASLC